MRSLAFEAGFWRSSAWQQVKPEPVPPVSNASRYGPVPVNSLYEVAPGALLKSPSSNTGSGVPPRAATSSPACADPTNGIDWISRWLFANVKCASPATTSARQKPRVSTIGTPLAPPALNAALLLKLAATKFDVAIVSRARITSRSVRRRSKTAPAPSLTGTSASTLGDSPTTWKVPPRVASSDISAPRKSSTYNAALDRLAPPAWKSLGT